MPVDVRISGQVFWADGSLLGHFRPTGDQWRRSIRGLGGFWQGTLIPNLELYDPFEMFEQWLGAHIQEQSGGAVTWEGLVYEMELSHGGSVYRRSLDLMANAVNVTYQTEGAVSETGFSTQAQAIARYGRKEEIVSVDNVPTATAQGLRARYLAGNAWPWARPISLGPRDQTRLEIRACGYVFTAQWLYLQAGDGSDHDLDHWINSIVGTAEGLSSDHGGSVSGAGDCQFLTAGSLASNTLQRKQAIESDIRAWSQLAELAALGDSSGDPWRVWVDVGRRLHYQAIELAPRYYVRGDRIYETAGGRAEANPWLMRPAVIRNLNYPTRRSEQGSSFADSRDQYVSELEVTAEGAVSFQTETFDESAIIMGQLEGAG